MNIELKPCPFCGGEAEARMSPNSRSEEGESFYEVRCKKCGVHVTGKSFNFWTVEYNAEKPQDLLSAVERWNKQAKRKDGRKTSKWIYTGFVGNQIQMGRCPECLNIVSYDAETGISFENYKFCPFCGCHLEGR